VRLVVASPAAQEFNNAVDFYEDLSGGLGQDLVDEFEGALSQIQEFPGSGSPYLNHTRRMLLHRFPFSVVYRVKVDLIEVVAFAHRSRRPGYWTESP